jgi:hypothetical protein
MSNHLKLLLISIVIWGVIDVLGLVVSRYGWKSAGREINSRFYKTYAVVFGSLTAIGFVMIYSLS